LDEQDHSPHKAIKRNKGSSRCMYCFYWWIC